MLIKQDAVDKCGSDCHELTRWELICVGSCSLVQPLANSSLTYMRLKAPKSLHIDNNNDVCW